jgi:hypothetical protein
MPYSPTAILIALILCVTTPLCGCGIVAQQQRAQAATEHREKMTQAAEIRSAAFQECKDRRLRGELKTHVEEARCANDRILAAYRGANYPYMDLVGLMTAARLAGAEQIDRGQITEAEMELQLAELKTRVANEERRRNLEIAEAQNRAAMVSTAQNQAVANSAAALLQGLSAFQAASRPAGFSCTTFGNMTNCR